MPPEIADIERILARAIEIPTPDELEAFLQQACGGDQELLRHVEELVNNHFQAGTFLEQPAHYDLPPVVVQNSAGDFTRMIGTVIGPYKLREQIGEGGMGVVYVAEQERPVRRYVALKLIKPGMDSCEVIGRFETERQALAMMDHPNIAKVFDAGTLDQPLSPDSRAARRVPTDSGLRVDPVCTGDVDRRTHRPGAPDLPGRPYFVMELVRGISITDFCDKGCFTPRERLKLFVQVCHAVQHAHQKGIIHRDLKPSNVLVTQHDGVPVPKVIDFGVAKAINQRLSEHTVYTRLSQIVGTPMYMSPEQAELSGLDVDTRSDVYALGVLLYELLTGTTPFDREQFAKAGFDEMRRMIREEEPLRPSQRVSTLEAKLRSTVSGKRSTDERILTRALVGELDWIVMKSLEKDRTRRYESASAFAADVQRYLDDEPVLACPPSMTYRLSKLVKRYRSAALVTAIVTISILGSSVFSALKYVDERLARQDAEEQKQLALHSARQAANHAAEATRERAKVEHQRDVARQNLYYADMGLAFNDIRAGNSGRAQEVLISHFPLRGEMDLRGWEWHYLLGRSHEAEHSVYGHGREVMTVAWSPDGKSLASVSYDGSAKVWETDTWELIRSFDHGPTLKYGVAWSPDSRKLAWGSVADESALRIWNRDTDAISVLHGPQGSIWAVAWSHDGRFVAAGSIAETPVPPENVYIYDVERREAVARFASVHNINSLSWSSDDRLLAVANNQDGPAIWDIASAQSVGAIITKEATCAAWHPSEPRLAVGNAFGECLIWDHRDQVVVSQWKAQRGIVTDVRWSGDGHRLISTGADGMAHVWDPWTRHLHRSVAAHAGSANSVTWEPSGKRFATGGTDHVIRVWAAESRTLPLVIDSRLRGNLNLAWNGDGSCLFLACGDAGKIAAFDAANARQIGETLFEPNHGRRLISFQHLMHRTESAARDPDSRPVENLPADGELSTVVSPTAYNGALDGAVLSPDGTRIAGLPPSGWGRPFIRDVHADREVVCNQDLVYTQGIAWSPDGRLIAVAGRGNPSDDGFVRHAGWVHVFEAERGERIAKLRIGPDRVMATAVAWSHDGRRLAVGNEQGLCEVWEWESARRLVSERIHSSRVYDLTWSPDDLRIASGGLSEQVHLWDSVTGQQLLELEPQKSPIRHIRWSPDGRKLAAVGEDGTVQVWDASAGHDLLRREFWRRMVETRDWKEYFRLVDEMRWSDVADLLQQMIDLETQDDLVIYRLALVRLQLGDEAGYRDACRKMLSEFAGTENRMAGYRTAMACALRPATLEDYGPVVALAQRVVDLSLDTRNPSKVRADYLEVLGANLLRAGRYQEALRRFEAAIESGVTVPGSSRARIEFLMAITFARLGRDADARMWLDRADRDARQELSNATQPPDWTRRLTLQLLQREAVQLVGNRSNHSR